MTGPRSMDDGQRVGYGLLLFLIASWAVMVGAAIDVAALLWKRWRRL